MRILFPVDTDTRNPSNPFLLQLLEQLHKCEDIEKVSFGSEILHWDPLSWDVVHFQWPEAYFSWRKPTTKEFARAEARLMQHKASGGIVITTIHNYKPKPEFEEMGEQVFELIYKNTDCFIHLGEASVDAFKIKYTEKKWYTAARHVVFYHGDYNYYMKKSYDNSSAVEIKKYDGKRILVFGALRTGYEESLARNVFKEANLGSNSVLVFAGNPSRSTIDKNVLAGDFDKEFGNIIRFHKRIPDNQVRSIFESVDIVFIPRTGRLNSGVISLAFTFGTPVVAPNEGVIREMIIKGGGLTYESSNITDAAHAINNILSLTPVQKIELKEKMDNFRKKEMAWPVLAKKHCLLYKSLLPNPKGGRIKNQFLLREKMVRGNNKISLKPINKICFSIALNGYDQKFKKCIDTHQQYCLRRGYKYWCIDSSPWSMTPKQCAWLKVEIMRGLLSAGFHMCGFLDADCELRPHTPPFENYFTDDSEFIMARGKSGRVNSGIMFARCSETVSDFLKMLILKSNDIMPQEDRTAYENGHFIHFTKGLNFISELDHLAWNNNTKLDAMSYVQHYSGGELRKWWNENIPHSPDLQMNKKKNNNQVDVKEVDVKKFLSMAMLFYSQIYKALYASKMRIHTTSTDHEV